MEERIEERLRHEKEIKTKAGQSRYQSISEMRQGPEGNFKMNSSENYEKQEQTLPLWERK